MNTIERAKAKVQMLEQTASDCKAEFDSVIGVINTAKNNLASKAEEQDKSGKAIIKSYIKKLDSIAARVEAVFGGAENE